MIGTGALPVSEQLFTVQTRPLQDESLCAPREATVDDFQWVNAYFCFVFGINRVKVWGRVISPVHVDHDAIEG